jgi:hypothetical protein
LVQNDTAVEGLGHVVEALELLAVHLLFFGEDFRVERLFELEQMP